MNADAREGRMRTQTTTLCLDSAVDDDVMLVALVGDAIGLKEVEASASSTVAKPDSTLVVV